MHLKIQAVALEEWFASVEVFAAVVEETENVAGRIVAPACLARVRPFALTQNSVALAYSWVNALELLM